MNIIKSLFAGLSLTLASLAWAGPIDINSADAKTLEGLNGVGPAKAEAIVEYRAKNGPFKSADDLEKVSGIGKATVEKNRDIIVVGGSGKAGKADKPASKKDPK